MIVACLTLLGAMTVQAQGKHHKGEMKTPEQRAEHKTNMLKDSLNLTDDQAEKILAINLDAEKKMDEAREANKGDREKMKEAMMTINKERREKIKALLTDEQKEKLKKMKDDHQHNDKKGEHKMKHHEAE